MSRLLRKLVSRIKVEEFVAVVVVVMISVLIGVGAQWCYQEFGRQSAFVVAVNELGTGDKPGSQKSDVRLNVEDGFEHIQSVATTRKEGSASAVGQENLLKAQGTPSYLALSGTEQQVVYSEFRQDSQMSGVKVNAPEYTDDEYNENTYIDAATDGESTEIWIGNQEMAGEPFGQSDQSEESGSEEIREAKGAVTAEASLEEYMVKVVVYGEKKVITTTTKTVQQLFDEYGIVLGEKDKLVGAYLDGVINTDLYIQIKKVTTKTVYEDKMIPAKTSYRDNASMAKGTTKVVQNGAEGKKQLEFQVVMEDGVQVDKQLVKEVVLKEPVGKIIEQGTSGTHEVKEGPSFSYSKVIDVKFTAYTASYEDTGKRPGDPGFGITASGLKAKKGVVAVDPSVIPLGSKLYIEIPGGQDYGYAIAGDTGGKIKGKKVDLYFDADRETLLEFGVKRGKVYILN